MKRVQMKQKDTMTLVIPAPKMRAIRLHQRGTRIESGKRYRRQDGKCIPE
jgi:hypothetical protein